MLDQKTISQMEAESIQPGCWPTENQELLLQACLFEGNEARDAWEKWRPRIDINWIDEGSHRLLPLLYHNLHPLGIEDPILTKAKGIYRFMLAKNHMMFHRAVPILKALQEKGIEIIFLKGAALTLLYYKNFALRPQLDIDFLVKPEKAEEAFETLLELGWKSEYTFPMKTILKFRHSCGFDAGAERRLDLHWNILSQFREQNCDAVFWEKAVPVELNNYSFLALNPTHHLFHNCLHGIQWNTHAPCRWVADVLTLIKAPTIHIDWDEIIRLAKERRATLPVKEGIVYLNKKFAAGIPIEYIEALENTPTRWLERRAHDIHTNDKSEIFGNLFKFTFDYLRLPFPRGFFRKLFIFPRYLQVCWKRENLWLMPFALIADSLRRNLKQ